MSHDATKWVIKQRGIKPALKVVLWNLRDRYHPDSGCFPSQETLAANCEVSRDALIDMDPPYLAASRSTGKLYKHEMSDRDHRQLLDLACASKAMAIVSGYPSQLYEQLLGDWTRVEIGAYVDGGARRTEAIWINPACCITVTLPVQGSRFTMSPAARCGHPRGYSADLSS
jgi:hypothetical protein